MADPPSKRRRGRPPKNVQHVTERHETQPGVYCLNPKCQRPPFASKRAMRQHFRQTQLCVDTYHKLVRQKLIQPDAIRYVGDTASEFVSAVDDASDDDAADAIMASTGEL